MRAQTIVIHVRIGYCQSSDNFFGREENRAIRNQKKILEIFTQKSHALLIALEIVFFSVIV